MIVSRIILLVDMNVVRHSDSVVHNTMPNLLAIACMLHPDSWKPRICAFAL